MSEFKSDKLADTLSNVIQKERRGHSFPGSLNPAWIGGRIIHSGYVNLYMPEHPYRDKQNYVPEHRIVMEKKIGRYLRRDEIVHHIDGNKRNNSSDNLVILTRGSHMRHHMTKYGDGYKCSECGSDDTYVHPRTKKKNWVHGLCIKCYNKRYR